jgi:hypothetical protein
MMNFVSHKLQGSLDSYKSLEQLDFRIITTGVKKLPFFEDDIFLGMQAINIGLIDQLITQYEYELLREYNRIEKTPDSTMAVSALSQMWIYALYEVLRMWFARKRKCESLKKEFDSLQEDEEKDEWLKDKDIDDDSNLTASIQKTQMLRFIHDDEYRKGIDNTHQNLEEIFRGVELIRINLAKHEAPKYKKAIPKSPGYGRINDWCGSLDFQLLEKNKNYTDIVDNDSYYTTLSRRDIADALRNFFTNHS